MRTIRLLLSIIGVLCTSVSWAVIRDTYRLSSVPMAFSPEANVLATLTPKTHTFTVDGYNLGRIDFHGVIHQRAIADLAMENRVLIVPPVGDTLMLRFSSATNYSGDLTFSGSFYLAPGTAMATSDAWKFYFYNIYDDHGNPDARIDVTFDLTDEEPIYPPAIDLDRIDFLGRTAVLSNVQPGEVKWLKFTTFMPTDWRLYLDIDTEGTNNFLGGSYPNDTVIALYDGNGNFTFKADDEDGDGHRSQLTFGYPDDPRPPVGNGRYYDGRDGTLPAGTHYLAVSGWPQSESQTLFGVTSGSTSTGDITVNFNSNLPRPPITLRPVETWQIIQGEYFSGSLADLTKSDDIRASFFCDPDSLTLEINFATVSPYSSDRIDVAAEIEASRDELVSELYVYNYQTAAFDFLWSTETGLTDWTLLGHVFEGAAPYFETGTNRVSCKVIDYPLNDEVPSQDGWLISFDEVRFVIF